MLLSLSDMLPPFHSLSRILVTLTLGLISAVALHATDTPAPRTTWMADNGNGTFTNPLFYDEFSDPDLIRVGEDFYLTGTTMHTMPGLPILHSKDLVNWRLLTYACDQLDLGPKYRLEGGNIYGQGIWAPSFRYHAGTFYIFTNVNGQKTQIFRATNPAGPWTRSEMRRSLHDLSVLFDDDGRVYVVWDYNELKVAELEADLTDIKPGTERVLIPKNSGMGEGSHFYKINGRYFITSANYDPMGHQMCARADRPEGPYEIVVMAARETLGHGVGRRLQGMGTGKGPLELHAPQPAMVGVIPMHQGGIVDTPSGEWWGFSMMDMNSVGRLTALSPVTWVDGWPLFGLPGNLTRSPRTWVKPKVKVSEAPSAPYQRSDSFDGPTLQSVWQWNHVVSDNQWSITERPGFLRLHAQPAVDFFQAKNSLTQRAMGPASIATAILDGTGLAEGDSAGLALLNHPYAWIGMTRTEGKLLLSTRDALTGAVVAHGEVANPRIHLRVSCNFDEELGQFSWSQDGRTFSPLGDPVRLVFQLKTFQGIRYALFAFNEQGRTGGVADFEDFHLDEPRANAGAAAIPVGKTISLVSRADGHHLVVHNGRIHSVPTAGQAGRLPSAFKVHDRGLGRVALEAVGHGGFIGVGGQGVSGDVRLFAKEAGDATMFQWQDMLQGDTMLLSLKTHRYLWARPDSGELVSADSPGAEPDRKDGACFTVHIVE